MGAIIADLDQEESLAMKKCGKALGMGFQIVDDILDVTSTEELLGKPIGSDLSKQKSTYLTLYTEKEATELASTYFKEALNLLTRPSFHLKHLINLCAKKISL